MNEKGLGIIFHSGSYDRINNGLSIAMAAVALGWEIKLFFSYWALIYLKKEKSQSFELDKEAITHKRLLEKNIREGHILALEEIFSQAKKMNIKFYSCASSMGLLNITRDELLDTVDKSMGLVTFLAEVSDYQILFI